MSSQALFHIVEVHKEIGLAAHRRKENVLSAIAFGH